MTFCRQGHRLRTDAGTVIESAVYHIGGQVRCRACDQARAKARYWKDPAAAQARARAKREREAAAEGRALGPRNQDKTHCPRGHAYTPENTRVEGWRRICVTCARANSRAVYRRLKAEKKEKAHGPAGEGQHDHSGSGPARR